MDYFKHKSDDRKEPDELRRAQFHMGFDNAESGWEYRQRTLDFLKWNNDGWRHRKAFGKLPYDEVDKLFWKRVDEWYAERGTKTKSPWYQTNRPRAG